MAALSGEKTLAQLRGAFGGSPAMISGWQELVKRAGELFARGSKAPAVEDAQKVIDDLHRKIGQLQVERDFLAGQPAIPKLRRSRVFGHQNHPVLLRSAVKLVSSRRPVGKVGKRIAFSPACP